MTAPADTTVALEYRLSALAGGDTVLVVLYATPTGKALHAERNGVEIPYAAELLTDPPLVWRIAADVMVGSALVEDEDGNTPDGQTIADLRKLAREKRGLD